MVRKHDEVIVFEIRFLRIHASAVYPRTDGAKLRVRCALSKCISMYQIFLLSTILLEQEAGEHTRFVLSGSPSCEGQSPVAFFNEPEMVLSTLRATLRDVLDSCVSHWTGMRK